MLSHSISIHFYTDWSTLKVGKEFALQKQCSHFSRENNVWSKCVRRFHDVLNIH